MQYLIYALYMQNLKVSKKPTIVPTVFKFIKTVLRLSFKSVLFPS